LAEIKEKQSRGGKTGAAKTNAGKSRVPRESVVITVQISLVQPSQIQ
jgi:hypothetical protein